PVGSGGRVDLTSSCSATEAAMVAVDADAAPEESRRRWRRGRGGADTMATLADARRVAAAVRGGLGGPDAGAAARGLCRMLDAEAVVLAVLHRAPAAARRLRDLPIALPEAGVS